MKNEGRPIKLLVGGTAYDARGHFDLKALLPRERVYLRIPITVDELPASVPAFLGPQPMEGREVKSGVEALMTLSDGPTDAEVTLRDSHLRDHERGEPLEDLLHLCGWCYRDELPPDALAGSVR